MSESAAAGAASGDLMSRLNAAMTSNLGVLRVLVPMSPLLGLLGTVSGMLNVFDSMAARGSADARSMANGVSEAMICTLTGLAVKSLIVAPLDGASVGQGPIDVAGFAWAGENDIAGVEVPTDHGETWKPARLVGEQQRFSWRRFEYRFTADRRASYLILSRATDTKGAAQPAIAHWNPSGYLWNQYDAVRIEVR